MKKTSIILLLLMPALQCLAQLNPYGSIYYHNQYLANPAMAGTEKGWELNSDFKVQWTAIDGSPSMQAVTAAYGSENGKVGFGLTLLNDRAGVVGQTVAKLSYAYHVPLKQGERYLSFGVSGGILNEWIDFKKVRGDLSDQSLYAFNARPLLFDGDFGVSYRGRHLNLQGAILNLNRFFRRDVLTVADRARFMAALGYTITPGRGIIYSVEPKVTYRSVENHEDIVDVGANFLMLDKKLIMSGMYRSTNSILIGAGTTYKERLTVLTLFTSNTSDLGRYGNGEFELALKYNFR